MEVGEEQDMLMEKLKKPQQRKRREGKIREISQNHPSTTEKLKLEKSARKSVDNSTCLHSDNFKIQGRI